MSSGWWAAFVNCHLTNSCLQAGSTSCHEEAPSPLASLAICEGDGTPLDMDTDVTCTCHPTVERCESCASRMANDDQSTSSSALNNSDQQSLPPDPDQPEQPLDLSLHSRQRQRQPASSSIGRQVKATKASSSLLKVPGIAAKGNAT